MLYGKNCVAHKTVNYLSEEFLVLVMCDQTASLHAKIFIGNEITVFQEIILTEKSERLLFYHENKNYIRPSGKKDWKLFSIDYPYYTGEAKEGTLFRETILARQQRATSIELPLFVRAARSIMDTAFPGHRWDVDPNNLAAQGIRLAEASNALGEHLAEFYCIEEQVERYRKKLVATTQKNVISAFLAEEEEHVFCVDFPGEIL